MISRSVTVLKGPSAALRLEKASNGVVIRPRMVIKERFHHETLSLTVDAFNFWNFKMNTGQSSAELLHSLMV
jgi:hypothetical protein